MLVRGAGPRAVPEPTVLVSGGKKRPDIVGAILGIAPAMMGKKSLSARPALRKAPPPAAKRRPHRLTETQTVATDLPPTAVRLWDGSVIDVEAMLDEGTSPRTTVPDGSERLTEVLLKAIADTNAKTAISALANDLILSALALEKTVGKDGLGESVAGGGGLLFGGEGEVEAVVVQADFSDQAAEKELRRRGQRGGPPRGPRRLQADVGAAELAALPPMSIRREFELEGALDGAAAASYGAVETPETPEGALATTMTDLERKHLLGHDWEYNAEGYRTYADGRWTRQDMDFRRIHSPRASSTSPRGIRGKEKTLIPFDGLTALQRDAVAQEKRRKREEALSSDEEPWTKAARAARLQEGRPRTPSVEEEESQSEELPVSSASAPEEPEEDAAEEEDFGAEEEEEDEKEVPIEEMTPLPSESSDGGLLDDRRAEMDYSVHGAGKKVEMMGAKTVAQRLANPQLRKDTNYYAGFNKNQDG